LLDSLLQEAVSSETNDHVDQSKEADSENKFLSKSATNKAKNSSSKSRKACSSVNDKVSKRNKRNLSDPSKTSDNNKADSVNFVAECYYKTVTFSAEDFPARLKRLRGEEEEKEEEFVDLEDFEDPGDTEASDLISDHFSSSCGISEFQSPSLMLSAEERQELAENAMEQLATGLNKAAETMQTVETSEHEPDDPAAVEAGQPVPDVASLQDRELFQLLEEAYSYKRPRDRQGKSEIFRELLEKAEENSSGEEQWDINFRKYMTHQDSSGKKKKKRVSESNKKGGSLSNLSCLSDNDSSSCKGNNKNKKSRSSVSSRSREGGSLPPTKFENVMLYETANNSSNFACPCAWDTGPLGSPAAQGMPEETFIETSELQPLLHSSSDTALRRRVVQSLDTRESVAIDMDGVGDTCETDSNKTEVEEIEMVEMESRDVSCEADSDEMTAARHRLETRQDFYNGDDREASNGSGDVDENGNPSSRHIHPIMHNNVRPVSIYRHTPVFRPQKLTVPHTVHNNGSPGYGSTSSMMTNGSVGDQGTDPRKASNGDAKRKNRRKKEEEKNTVKAEDIEGYRGNKDIDSLLEFLGEGEESKKKSKKTSEKVVDKSKKVTTKSDSSKDEKVRKKKEKSQEKDVTKPAVTKKLSTDNLDNDVIEEEDKGSQSPKDPDSVRQSMSPDKDGRETERGSPCVPDNPKTPSATAPSSNDSGHVSGGPFSLPSISSTKEMSIASSPPLDLDSIEFTEESLKDVADVSAAHHSEFTKVTKKQRKKKKRGVYPPGSHEAGVRATSQDPESEHGGGWSFRGYRSRETVSGTKSTCSVPPSEASDTDDHDSVHSLPVGSTRTKVAVCVASVSSGHTPHASYADIARHAAALQTQQQGQKQHDVYREQLQYREYTPGGNTKESVSSNEDYFYNPDLDASFPPVQPQTPFSILLEAESPQNQSESNNSSHSKHRSYNSSSNNNNNITNNNPPPPTTQTQSTDTQHQTSRNQSVTSDNKLKSNLRQNKSDPSIVLPPVVILQKEQFEANSTDTGFTFGFEVNESLLAMSFVDNDRDILDNKVISDNLNNGDNVIGNNEEGCDNKGLVVNQSYEDNEMMKKLLLCADEEPNPEKVVSDDVDDEDVVVESSTEPQDFKKLKNILCEVDNLNYKNFNYDVIVHFVSKAWDVVSKEMKSGRQVCYYSS